MKARIFLDSFSGAASDLPKGQRSSKNVLRILAKSPRVSTFDMSEHAWLCSCINDLKKRGAIREKDETYPWHRYEVTPEGMAELTEETTP